MVKILLEFCTVEVEVEVLVVDKEFWARDGFVTKVRGRKGRNVAKARVREALAIAVYVYIEASRTRILIRYISYI